jgi:hypothetical protein
MRTHPTAHPATAIRHAALLAIALIALWLLLVACLPRDAARPPARDADLHGKQAIGESGMTISSLPFVFNPQHNLLQT